MILSGILAFAAPRLFSVDPQNQIWLTFEKGNAAFASREFGRALQLYKDSISVAGIFPEAEIAIGDVYLEEGEVDLAIRQYDKAYNMRNAFYISESRFTVLLKLANLYLAQQSYGLMEQSLLSIIAEDKHFADTLTFKLRSQIEKNYLEKGLDRVFMLYVFDDQFAAPAHSLLGWYAYRSGRHTQAIDELLYSLISRTSEIVAFLHERDADFEYSSLVHLLTLVSKTSEAALFLKEIGFFKDLYYLAAATYASGYPQTASELWKVIAGYSAAGTYQDLSRKQLKTPWIEPLLSVPVSR